MPSEEPAPIELYTFRDLRVLGTPRPCFTFLPSDPGPLDPIAITCSAQELGANRTTNYALIEPRTTTCCRSPASFSSRRQPNRYKSPVELLAEPDVVLIDLGVDLGRSVKGTHDTVGILRADWPPTGMVMPR